MSSSKYYITHEGQVFRPLIGENTDGYQEVLVIRPNELDALVAERVREELTNALHPEFGTEWREPDGIIYQAVQQALTERRPTDD